MGPPNYQSDVDALRTVALQVLDLGDNDVLDIGALDPQEYDQTALSIGDDVEVKIAWVRWGKSEETTSGSALRWIETRSISIRVNETEEFSECLAKARTLRDALDGMRYRAADCDDDMRTLSVTDAVPGFTDNYDLKTVQIFIDIS